MAKSRLITTNLVRAFDRIGQPVYLINEENQLVYLNQACLEWLQLDLEEVKSAKCVYTSERLEDPIENRLRGLTPPPLNLTAPVENPIQLGVFCETKNGKQLWRNATSHPLFAEGILEGQLVICSESTFPSPEQIDVSKVVAWQTDPQTLHESLASIRSQINQRYQLPALLGLPSMTRPIRKRIDVAIQSKAECIIFGPSGSGREHLARSLDRERRPEGSPAILLHCAVADQQLVQRNIKELLGSSKSDNDKPECLLLLDVDQLSPAAQAELWGFVQLPGFSFQTIATATESIAKLASNGKFQSELAAHLSTVEIELLPLHQRADDIPLIAQSCLEHLNKDRERPLIGFSTAAMKLLQQFNWPDNIDQLIRDIRSAAKRSTGNKVVLEDLPVELRQARLAQEIGTAADFTINLENYLQRIECELILRAMQHAKGNKSKAAKLLNISRPKLLRRLQLLDVANESESGNDGQVDSSAFEEADDE